MVFFFSSKFLGVETRGSVISIVIYHHYRGFELVVGEGSGRALPVGIHCGMYIL